jgi:hypothetical protein
MIAVESSYIQFHVAIGWSGVAFGLAAMALRVPDFLCLLQRVPKQLQLLIHYAHSILGGLFLMCALFMPITANWIWPRYGTPSDIIYLIASMYISIVLGLICIRMYRFKVGDYPPKTDFVVQVATQLNDTNASVSSQIENGNEDPSAHTMSHENALSWWISLKYLHAIFMTYSLVMLFGAGQAFLENSRTQGFPYPQGELADSLVGRCYGRNLQPPNLEDWLRNMTCGFSVMCKR